MQTAHLLAEKAVNVRSEVREAFIAYKGAFEVARLYQAQVEPLQNEILKQSLLQTSTMQTDVFVLVQDARTRILAHARLLMHAVNSGSLTRTFVLPSSGEE